MLIIEYILYHCLLVMIVKMSWMKIWLSRWSVDITMCIVFW